MDLQKGKPDISTDLSVNDYAAHGTIKAAVNLTRLASGQGVPSNIGAEREIPVDDHAADHVKSVEARHREVHGEIGARPRVHVLVEMARVLYILDDQERESEKHRDGAEHLKLAEIIPLERRPSHDHRDGGRNQDDRVERGERDVENRGSPRPARCPRPDQDVARK